MRNVQLDDNVDIDIGLGEKQKPKIMMNQDDAMNVIIFKFNF